MSVLSLLTSVVLAGLVYGLSFLPNATLTQADDEIGVGLNGDEPATETKDADTKHTVRA